MPLRHRRPGRHCLEIDLQFTFLYPINTALPTAAVWLRDGHRIEGSLAHDDEFSIALIGRDGWYRSWPRDDVRVEIHNPLAGHRALLARYTNQDVHNILAYLVTIK